MTGVLRRLTRTAGVAAATWAVTRGAAAAARGFPRHVHQRWERTNHRGDTVSLIQGPILVAGSVVGALITSLLDEEEGAADDARPTRPGAAAVMVALTASAVAGAADDFASAGDPKGLQGHLGALRRGQLTTGVVKIGALGAAGFLSAVAETRTRPGPSRGPLGRLLNVGLGTVIVAGSANLANLLDLRPGRALKSAIIAATPLAFIPPGSPSAAVSIGSGLAVLPDDLAGRTMLGDTGANPLGALVGIAALGRTGLAARLLIAAGLVGLTVLSERVSFSEVIERTPSLRALDRWGRHGA